MEAQHFLGSDGAFGRGQRVAVPNDPRSPRRPQEVPLGCFSRVEQVTSSLMLT
jgi:hypothetical protein